MKAYSKEDFKNPDSPCSCSAKVGEGAVIFRSDTFPYKSDEYSQYEVGTGKARNQVEAWLSENYPLYEDPSAYWEEDFKKLDNLEEKSE